MSTPDPTQDPTGRPVQRGDRSAPPGGRPPGTPPYEPGYGPEGREPGGNSGGGRNVWMWIAIVLALVVAVGLIIWLLTGEEELQPAESGMTVDDIVDNPGEYLGETVSLTGRVQEVVDNRAFTISPAEFDSEAELLVIGSDSLLDADGEAGELLVFPGETLELTGEVRLFDLVDLGQELGTSFDAGDFEAYEDEPVLVATEIYGDVRERIGDSTTSSSVASSTTTSTTVAETTTTAAPAAEPETTTTMEPRSATVNDIVSGAQDFIGADATLVGTVVDPVGERTFALAAEGAQDGVPLEEKLLVVAPPQLVDQVEVGVVVEVTGNVRRFDAGFRNSFQTELDEQTIQEWEGRPAILVTQPELFQVR